MLNQNEEYTVELRGIKVYCATVEQVVETVQALTPLAHQIEREVPVPQAMESGNPVTAALYALYREAPQWRRPVEIIKALRKRGVPKAEVQYARVYAALRYGDFVKQDGRWNVSDAA